MNQASSSKYTPGILSLLPIFYVTWSDSVLSPSEIKQIRKQINNLDFLSFSDKRQLAQWLDPAKPPKDEEFKEWISIIRIHATDLQEIEKNKLKEAEGIAKKIPSHEKTLELITRGKSIKDIAMERKMTIGTILSHLEKLKEGKYEVDLKQFKPKSADLKAIKTAFKGTKDMKLAPAHRKLKGKYSYEELRLARLFVG